MIYYWYKIRFIKAFEFWEDMPNCGNCGSGKCTHDNKTGVLVKGLGRYFRCGRIYETKPEILQLMSKCRLFPSDFDFVDDLDDRELQYISDKFVEERVGHLWVRFVKDKKTNLYTILHEPTKVKPYNLSREREGEYHLVEAFLHDKDRTIHLHSAPPIFNTN